MMENRGVFRIQLSIYDGTFCEIVKPLTIFAKNTQSQMLGWVLNMSLLTMIIMIKMMVMIFFLVWLTEGSLFPRSQPAFICSKLTIEIPGHSRKYVQSKQ